MRICTVPSTVQRCITNSLVANDDDEDDGDDEDEVDEDKDKDKDEEHIQDFYDIQDTISAL